MSVTPIPWLKMSSVPTPRKPAADYFHRFSSYPPPCHFVACQAAHSECNYHSLVFDKLGASPLPSLPLSSQLTFTHLHTRLK
ncbi:unnamed protein product [Protopolystoma xenopodis]|uniref:Uncharacterized protein n=1 Tax=Protopolystoma xenopodis TaxID=117903 RepID=A0A448XI16_9PLAT|nr:unnamed protein product [Protopolystoma xenopodis]